jgi:hypothetical protein
VVAFCAAVVVIAAGAGVGTWLAVRGDNSPGRTAGDVASGEIDTAKIRLAGQIVLPEGSTLSPEDLTILSNTSETGCSATGAFALDAVHDKGARTPVLVLNKDRNLVFMAVADSDRDDLRPSVVSTVRALVLHDPAFLSLPAAAYQSASARLESHPSLSALESALAEAVVNDPAGALDPDAHPRLYDLAAEIAADLLSGIIKVDERAVAGRPTPPLLAAAGDFAVAPASFVDVIDDLEHKTTEVTLVNTTWAHYIVTCTLTASKATSTKTFFLPRCAPWRVDLDSLRVAWPPVGFKYEKSVDVGDGQLSFQFRRNDEYMIFDIGANLAVLLAGAGAESIRKMAGDGEGVAAALRTNAALMQLAKEFGALSARMQGQGYSGCAKELGGFLVANGGRVLIAFWPFLQNEIKEEFFTVLGRVVTRRMAALAVLGYGSVDLIAQLKALGDPAIANYDTGGVQLAGVYPFSAIMEFSVSPSPRDAQTYAFQVSVRGLPGDFDVPLELEMDFGDGSPKEIIRPNIEAGIAVVSFRHTYAGTIPKKVRAVLRTSSPTPALIASKEAALSGKERGAGEVWFTVRFQGGGSFNLTLDGAPGTFEFDFVRFLDPINVYGHGRAYAEYATDRGTCTFEGQYDRATKKLTGRYQSSFTRIEDDGTSYSESASGTLEGTLTYRPNEVPGKPYIFTMRGTIACSGQVVFVDRDVMAPDDSYQRYMQIDYSFVANGDTGYE